MLLQFSPNKGDVFFQPGTQNVDSRSAVSDCYRRTYLGDISLEPHIS